MKLTHALLLGTWTLLVGVGCGGSVESVSEVAQGDSASSTPNKPAPHESTAPRAEPQEQDFTIEPGSVEEAKKLCATPPSDTDWEVNEAPDESTYYGFRWVMCNPSLVITAPTTSRCSGNDSMEGCGLPTIEGIPYSTWAFNLQWPDNKEMMASFPIDDHRIGVAIGKVEQARGGLAHWLRLPLEPEYVTALGTSNVVFVRIRRPTTAS